jgi:hypothetical protein
VIGEIRVRGRLSDTMLGAFPESRAQVQGAETLLAGQLPDQAALSASWPGSKLSVLSCSKSTAPRGNPDVLLSRWRDTNPVTTRVVVQLEE